MMDISFYALLTIACIVLVLAMWACAASNTMKWGPDLTLELPPHVIQEALFRQTNPSNTKYIGGHDYKRAPIPSAPSELPCAPLLCNEQPIGISSPPLKTFNPAVMLNMDTAVRVLPPLYEPPKYKIKPAYYKFSTQEPA